MIAYKSGVKYGIQCKYYSAPVGNKAVQEAYSGARFYDCDRAVVMTNHTFTKAARELADKLEVELWEHCSPGRETGKFRKLIHAFLFLFLLAGIAAGASMQIFQYPKTSLLNYLDVFLAVTASLLGIFGWRFLSLNLLSGALYLILFFLLLFSGAAKILPSEVLPVFFLPAVLLSGHAIFLQRQKALTATARIPLTIRGLYQTRIPAKPTPDFSLRGFAPKCSFCPLRKPTTEKNFFIT